MVSRGVSGLLGLHFGQFVRRSLFAAIAQKKRQQTMVGQSAFIRPIATSAG
jgi:hypothetical protein